MDYQTLINIGAGTALGVVGWFARQLWDANASLRSDLAKLREELPNRYVLKDDLRDIVRDLKELLMAIDRKLDAKADKP
jgi:hypothetical protein